jgi:hypothetical protein
MSHLEMEFCYPEILRTRSAGYFDLEIPHRIVAEEDQVANKMVPGALFILKPAGENH